jgi:hypothetical protein
MVGYIRCQICNNVIPKDSDICPFCGNELKKVNETLITQDNNTQDNNTQILNNEKIETLELLKENQYKNQEEISKENENINLIISKEKKQKAPDFFEISLKIIKNNFSPFLIFSLLSNVLITLFLASIILIGFLFLGDINFNEIFDFDFKNFNIYILIFGALSLLSALLTGLTINIAYLNDITYNTCKKIIEIKNSIKNNNPIDYKIYQSPYLVSSLKNGVIMMWYQLLYFTIPFIFLVILYIVNYIISSSLISSPLCCIGFIINILVNFLIFLIYTIFYLSFFIYYSLITYNNQKFNLIESYKFILSNLITKNSVSSISAIIIYYLISQWILPLLYLFFIVFTLSIGLLFLNLPILIINTFIFAFLILNLKYDLESSN